MENRVVFGGFVAPSCRYLLGGQSHQYHTPIRCPERGNSCLRHGLTRKQLCQMTIYGEEFAMRFLVALATLAVGLLIAVIAAARKISAK